MWRHYLSTAVAQSGRGIDSTARSTFRDRDRAGRLHHAPALRSLPDPPSTLAARRPSASTRSSPNSSAEMAARRAPPKGPWPAAAAFRQDFAEVESATATSVGAADLQRDGASEYIEMCWSPIPSFFDVLELPFLRGDPATALARPNDMVFTESEARRLFGTSDIIGRTPHLRSGRYAPSPGGSPACCAIFPSRAICGSTR